MDTENTTITLEYVRALPLDDVYSYALKHLKNLERKKKWNRKYNSQPKTKTRQREYYYKKNNIYHPEYNSEGTHEKRFKRTQT